MTTVLQGPFLTRAEAAARAGVDAAHVSHRPDLLRLDGGWLEEVYFAFQFSAHGVRRDVGEIVLHLRGHCPDSTIADWLCRQHPDLGGVSPLVWVQTGGSVQCVLDAADHLGPPEPAVAKPMSRPEVEPLPGRASRSMKRHWLGTPFAHGH